MSKKHMRFPGVMAHTGESSTQEGQEDSRESEISRGYLVSPRIARTWRETRSQKLKIIFKGLKPVG